MLNNYVHFCAFLLMLWAAGSADAVSMQLVTVGNPGNPGELSGDNAGGYGPNRVCGAVGYGYQMGKFEVTAGQYAEFLNAVAKTDTYGLYNWYMWTYPMASGTECKILQSGTSGSYSYAVAAGYANKPVNFVSWGDAARFCNWLANGQPTGLQGPLTPRTAHTRSMVQRALRPWLRSPASHRRPMSFRPRTSGTRPRTTKTMGPPAIIGIILPPPTSSRAERCPTPEITPVTGPVVLSPARAMSALT